MTASTPGSRSTPTTPPPSIIGKGEFGQGDTTGLLQIAAEELDLDMSQMRSVQLDTNVTPNQGATISSASDRARRAADPRGRGRSAAGAAEPRLDPARHAGRQPRGQQRRRFDRRPPDPLGHLRRAARRQAVQREVHRHGAAEGRSPATSSSAPACRASTFPRRPPAHTRTCSTCACRTCCMAASCGRAGSAPTATARSRWRSTRARSRTSRRAIVRKGDFVGVVAENEWDASGGARAQGDLAGEHRRCPAMPICSTHMRAAKTTDVDHRQLGRCRQGVRQGGARLDRDLSLPVPVACAVRPELRDRRCRRRTARW